MLMRDSSRRDARADSSIEPLAESIDVAAEIVLPPDDELRGGRGRRRAKVSDEIGDGEVGFVAHAGDHRNRRRGNGARDFLFVERPEIFERPATARDDDHIDAAGRGRSDGTRARSRPRRFRPARGTAQSRGGRWDSDAAARG